MINTKQFRRFFQFGNRFKRTTMLFLQTDTKQLFIVLPLVQSSPLGRAKLFGTTTKLVDINHSLAFNKWQTRPIWPSCFPTSNVNLRFQCPVECLVILDYFISMVSMWINGLKVSTKTIKRLRNFNLLVTIDIGLSCLIYFCTMKIKNIIKKHNNVHLVLSNFSSFI